MDNPDLLDPPYTEIFSKGTFYKATGNSNIGVINVETTYLGHCHNLICKRSQLLLRTITHHFHCIQSNC
jgi:hypothetical protein